MISTRSARVGGDTPGSHTRGSPPGDFNPLRPCGRRQGAYAVHQRAHGFQPAPPVWAETYAYLKNNWLTGNFNPLRPCGRRPYAQKHGGSALLFQPTPPVWAETGSNKKLTLDGTLFQPTPPVWAETTSGSTLRRWRQFQPTPPVWAETS